MKKTLSNHALNSLAHPASIFAMMTLMINALVLQPRFPSWWTGKIGDMAWLVFSPFLFAWLLTFLIPSSWKMPAKKLGLVAIVGVGIAYSLLKTVPSLNDGMVHFGLWLGFPLKLQLDPTDLLALPCLLLAWFIWRREPQRHISVAFRLLVVSGAALAIMADAPAIRYEGFTCVLKQEDKLVALTESIHPAGYFKDPENRWTAYVSSDGGLNWEADENFNTEEFVCPNTANVFPINVSIEPTTQLYYMEKQGIYRSDDGGNTMTLEQRVSIVNSVVLDESAQIVVIAAGEEGVMVRAADGTWQVVLSEEAALK